MDVNDELTKCDVSSKAYSPILCVTSFNNVRSTSYTKFWTAADVLRFSGHACRQAASFAPDWRDIPIDASLVGETGRDRTLAGGHHQLLEKETMKVDRQALVAPNPGTRR